MEQFFSAFGVDWKLLIAQAVNFGILLVALTYLLYKPVLATLDKRREIVAKGVEDAQAAEIARAESEGAATERLQSAETEAQRIVAEARTHGGEEKSRIVHEAEAQAARVAEAAKAQAAETKERALRESEKEIARLAILAAEKAIRQKNA